MANEEHLERIWRGVVAWNNWRERPWPERPEGVEHPDLRGADLSRANLIGADLRGADLRGADLSCTNLIGASLRSAHLYGGNLSRALLGGTAIFDVDLSQSERLETVDHLGPSGIATSTLERTAAGLARDGSRQGAIETFYRGAGVEEHLIEYFRSRISVPIRYFSNFISYSRADQPFTRRLYDGFQGRGIRCWLDVHDMKVGERILDSVNEAIRLHDKVLLAGVADELLGGGRTRRRDRARAERRPVDPDPAGPRRLPLRRLRRAFWPSAP